MSLKSVCSKVWLGVKIASSIVVNIYFIIGVILYLSLSHLYQYYTAVERPSQSKVPDNAIISISLNPSQGGQFDEHSTYGVPQRVWQTIFGGSTFSSYSFEEQMAALKNAAKDKRVKGIVVELNDLLFNRAQAYELSQALLTIRDAGKPVYVYNGKYLLNNNLLVASAATERFVAPNTFVRPERPNYGAVFQKGFYDKFDIDFTGQRMSLYKDFILKDVKYQVDQDVKSTFDEKYSSYLVEMNLIAKNYKLPVSKFDLDDKQLLDVIKSGDGNLAVGFQQFGWYKHIMTPAEFDIYVAKNLGARKGYKYVPNYISLNSYTNAQKTPLFAVNASKAKKHIAYLTLTGDVVRFGKSNKVISLNNTVSYLKSIYYNANNVEALVIRIDSPGGSTYTGETVRNLLDGIRAKGVPIVVSQGFLAASAGYMISSAANYIYTTPVTITGSIGVVLSSAYNLNRFVGNFGVKANTYGPNYLFGSSEFKIPFFMGGNINPYASQQADYFKALIAQSYWSFINSVYQGRKAHFASVQDVNKIAQGHEWGAVSAMKLGLVDAYGDVQSAITKARDLVLADQKTRKTDKFSPDQFTVLTADQIAKLPVIYYNPDFRKVMPASDLYYDVLNSIDNFTGNHLSNLVNKINTTFLAPVQPQNGLEAVYQDDNLLNYHKQQ